MQIGVVSYLNSKPLIQGLAARSELDLTFAVPANLHGQLADQRVDVALLPVFDLIREPERYIPISSAGIACDGPTYTVRVFSRRPANEVSRLVVDPDSHSSVALATVLWQHLFGVSLELVPPAKHDPARPDEARLLIGDKVVQVPDDAFEFQLDLGAAWKDATELPFVFATWAVRRDFGPDKAQQLANLLDAARDAGVAAATEIAREFAPLHGWEVADAERYLTHYLKFTLDDRYRAGMTRFAELCQLYKLAPSEIDPSRADALLDGTQ